MWSVSPCLTRTSVVGGPASHGGRGSCAGGASTWAAPVEGLVGEPVGVGVLLPRDPGVRRAGRRQPVRLQRQRPHRGVLDLPAPRHLLDDELGVQAHLELGPVGVLAVELEPGDEPAVLRHVVARDADAFPALGDHLAGVGVLQDGAVRRRAGVAARPPSASMTTERWCPISRAPSEAGLVGPHQDAAALLAADHLVGGLLRDVGQLAAGRARGCSRSQRRARSSAAPTPLFCSRSFS